jgi:phosphoribosylamine--glycine ligase
MGAYSPAPIVTAAMHERIMREVMEPTVRGLAAEGMHCRGFLYAGLMIDSAGTPRVLEFKCRMGDPETQPILARLRSDLVAHCLAALEGRLPAQHPEWDSRAAVGVVMASGGYPESYRKGLIVGGLESVPTDSFKVFHAGTAFDGEKVVTSGGRVLCAVALGDDVSAAQQRVYSGLAAIHWDGAFYRHDIGHRAIARESSASG